jgi:hypothetical protein
VAKELFAIEETPNDFKVLKVKIEEEQRQNLSMSECT